MDQALNSQKTPHTSPLRASYGMSFVSILMKNDRVIKGFYCIMNPISWHNKPRLTSISTIIKGSIDIFCRLECTHNDIPEDNYCHWHNIPMMNSNLPYFADNILKCNIMCGNCCVLIPNSMRFLSESTINNKAIAMTPTTTCGDIKPALFQIMAWCRVGDNPLSKPIMTWFTDAYSIYVSTDEKSLPTLVHHGIFMTFDDYRYIIWDIQQYFFSNPFHDQSEKVIIICLIDFITSVQWGFHYNSDKMWFSNSFSLTNINFLE